MTSGQQRIAEHVQRQLEETERALLLLIKYYDGSAWVLNQAKEDTERIREMRCFYTACYSG